MFNSNRYFEVSRNKQNQTKGKQSEKLLGENNKF